MNKKSNRFYGIVGLALLVLAVCLIVSKSGDDEQIKKQTLVITPRESIPATKKPTRPVKQEGSKTVTLRFKAKIGE